MECERLMGIAPSPTAMRGGALKRTWTHKQFIVDPLINVQAWQYAHAYILYMINTILFLNYPTNPGLFSTMPTPTQISKHTTKFTKFLHPSSNLSLATIGRLSATETSSATETAPGTEEPPSFDFASVRVVKFVGLFMQYISRLLQLPCYMYMFLL